MNIRLFCAAGMSTSLLVTKMRAAAEKAGLDADIAAYSINELGERLEGCDVALLGPQVGYQLNMVKKICEPKQIPVAVIPMVDYGLCNGEKVLAFAKDLIK